MRVAAPDGAFIFASTSSTIPKPSTPLQTAWRSFQDLIPMSSVNKIASAPFSSQV